MLNYRQEQVVIINGGADYTSMLLAELWEYIITFLPLKTVGLCVPLARDEMLAPSRLRSVGSGFLRIFDLSLRAEKILSLRVANEAVVEARFGRALFLVLISRAMGHLAVFIRDFLLCSCCRFTILLLLFLILTGLPYARSLLRFELSLHAIMFIFELSFSFSRSMTSRRLY